MTQKVKERTARKRIVWNFSVWVAGSAARRGAITLGHGWDNALEGVPGRFDEMLKEHRPNQKWFDDWHDKTVTELMGKLQCNESYGWTAKIVNMITKVQVYLAGCGDPGLKRFIHPPVDHYLVKGLKDEFRKNRKLGGRIRQLRRMTVSIRSVDSKTYFEIVGLLRDIAHELELTSPFELEKYWKPPARAIRLS